MVSTKQDIIEWVLAAKEDSDAADSLISQYMGFIRAEAKKLSFGDGEDELSIAMLAFYEAVLGYEKSVSYTHLDVYKRQGRGLCCRRGGTAA